MLLHRYNSVKRLLRLFQIFRCIFFNLLLFVIFTFIFCQSFVTRRSLVSPSLFLILAVFFL